MAGHNPPTTWKDYERGISSGTPGSVSSFGDQNVLEEQSFRDGIGRPIQRRNSLSRQLGAVVDIGGVNSIRSFTRSWARAAAFQEVIPQRPAFVFAPDQTPILPTDGIQYGRADDLEAGAGPRVGPHGQSLLTQAFIPPRMASPGAATEASTDTPLLQSARPHTTDFRERERWTLESELQGAHSVGSNVFGSPPRLASSPIFGSFSSFQSYGTIGSSASRASMMAAGPLWRHQREAEASAVAAAAAAAALGDETQPILVKEVEQDGKLVLAVEGQSTLPQTVFNSINVLVGVGLLSLPMGLKYAGWIPGMITLTLVATVTAYTSKLLAKCMDLDVSLITFSDIAFISFGSKARIATSILFTMELMAACVALVVLFADSLHLLFPGVFTVVQWKFVCGAFLLPLNFMPLRLLSYTSVLGIMSCSAIVLIVISDGLIKTTAPGSLVHPATTYLWPANWLTLPLSFGLLMSCWGGHSVFPNIYRDMRHPQKYGRAIGYTFGFTYLIDATMAVVGILMFGDKVLDEITSSIILTSGYPRLLTFLMCLLIGLMPLTKIPLNARPIVSTIEVLAGLHQPPSKNDSPRVASWKKIGKAVVRVGTVLCIMSMAILFPEFDTIMAFMGSALCFSICIILPIAFYLKLFGHEIGTRERVLCWVLMFASSILCVVGTIWAFLPKRLIGAE